MGVTPLTPEELAERWHMLGRRVLYPLPEVERIEQARLTAATTVKAHE